MTAAALRPAGDPAAAYRRVAFDALVMGADGRTLTTILYDELVAAIAAARAATATRDHARRSAALTRAHAALNGLEIGLDFDMGGQPARLFAAQYQALRDRLLTRTLDYEPAAFDALLAEARDLADIWQSLLKR